MTIYCIENARNSQYVVVEGDRFENYGSAGSEKTLHMVTIGSSNRSPL